MTRNSPGRGNDMEKRSLKEGDVFRQELHGFGGFVARSLHRPHTHTQLILRDDRKPVGWSGG